MHYDVDPRSASEMDALSLRMKTFTVIGVAAVLCFSIYSFIALGRAFAEQKCTPVYLSGKIDSRGRPSAEALSYAGISICMKYETEGAISGMWREDGFKLEYPWHVPL
jgi:hypothetical protein